MNIVKDPSNIHGSEAPADGPEATSLSLLSGLRNRDAQAWRQLAGLYGPLVYQWCRAKGLQSKDAEDILQEVFLTVARRIGDFRHEQPEDTFRGWLWTITRNKLGDWLRKQQTQPTALGGTEAQQKLADVPEETPAAAIEPGDVGNVCRVALDRIRSEFEPRTWQAFWQTVIDERDPADVARDLGLSRNAVYIARSRVLRRAREVLGNE
jgi:RNA polymerase sigma-70 factor (ECF subfamily)